MTTPPPSPSASVQQGRRAVPGPGKDGVDRPTIGGVPVREEDIDAVQGLRSIAVIFRGLAALLLLLMVAQIYVALRSIVPVSYGVIAAESIRLIIFAGLLWGAGDLAVLYVKSHNDIRATRILMARMAYMMRQMGEADGRLPPASAASREDRGR